MTRPAYRASVAGRGSQDLHANAGPNERGLFSRFNVQMAAIFAGG
jgi:hypothetical protein